MVKPLRYMPGPRSFPVIGALLQYTSFGPYSFDRLHIAKKENFLRYGNIYKEKLGPVTTIIQLFDPESVGKVFRNEGRSPCRPALPITLTANKRDRLMLGLGSLNGDDWATTRSSVQKLMMHPRAASVYLPAQNAVADDFLTLIRNSMNEDGEVTDFYQMILKYTMESIGTVCYNARLGCLEQHLQEDSVAHQLVSSTAAMFEAVQKTMFSFPWFAIFRSPLYNQFINAKHTCDRIARSYIEKMTTECLHVESGSAAEQSVPNFLTSLVATNKLEPNRVVAMTNELFIAGIDSTANALAFVIYNLAKNPLKQKILCQEIDTCLQYSSNVISPDVIESMSYLRACVKESFRLNYPVEGGTIRILEKDVTLNDYNVPKGCIIAMNNQTMCRQEEYFDHPDQFIPERWLKTGSATLRPPPKFIMLPFGYGPRMCIGRRFAEQEIYLALIKILGSFNVEYHHEDIGMINRVFTVPDKPLRIKLIPRDNKETP